MGTPDFSVGTLEAVLAAGHEVAAVVTQPDKPKGRGGAMSMSPVKEAALKHNLTVLQPQRAREEAFIEELRGYEADVIVVVAFGQLLPAEIIHMPKYGCINVHASLLPKYRGAAPIQWAVIDGCEYSGVTTMQMNEGLDTGDILLTEKVKLNPKETGGSLFDRLSDVGAQLLVKTLEEAKAGTLKPQKQNEEEASYVKISGKSIPELVEMPVSELKDFFDHLELTPAQSKVAERILPDIRNRLEFLLEVGLGYLTLNRLSSSLSGGESQRINLATSLGSSLVGSLYILDEPSIGLHSRDTEQLIRVLKRLRDLGNTVVVVEHDEDIIKAADEVIDIGPLAGRLGGEVVFQGNMRQLKTAGTLTADYIYGKRKIEIPEQRRAWNKQITISGATENNLKNITVRFPLKVMTAVTGVSGSGKSTLIKSILVPALKKYYGDYSDRTGSFDKLSGDMKSLSGVEFIDQNPIGKSTRSNPVTYLKAWDEIRKIFADTQAAKLQGFKASHFSFNVPGGRCEECQGEGIIKVEMQFMADVYLECEHCKGRRFKDDVLEVLYKNKSIYDILEMTVNQALEFFSESNGHCERSVVDKLQKLVDVGLGYVKLGQPSSTLSGGESQRVKLAYHLSRENAEPTLFVFDEPTTGLHFHDIHKLMESLNALIERGHSVLIIEHNMDVIKCADYVIELGPEGGKNGGTVVFEGTPEELVNCPDSYTGRYLREKLK